jgi:hypothetical protein
MKAPAAGGNAFRLQMEMTLIMSNGQAAAALR